MTTNRREFLQIGVSATAWPLVARTMQATGIEPLPERVTPSLVPLSLVVYDTRFPESIAFALSVKFPTGIVEPDAIVRSVSVGSIPVVV